MKWRNYIHYTWYYPTVALAILLLLPFLLFSLRPSAAYSAFFSVARIWGHLWLRLMGLFPQRNTYTLKHNGPFILVANHGSDLDIPLTFVTAPKPVVFVGKAELAKLPLFGYFFRKTSIPVDRSSFASQRQAWAAADQRIKDGYSICIFPEGGVPDPKWLLGPFKKGAFKVAVDNGVPVVVAAYYDNKFRLGHWGGHSSMGRTRVKYLAELWPDQTAEKPVDELSTRVYKLLASDLKAAGHTGKEALSLN